MGFSHLFILQLRSWPRGLRPPNLDSGLDLFDLLILDLLLQYLLAFDLLILDLLLQHLLAFDLLILHLLLQHLLAFDLLLLPLHPLAFMLEPTLLNAQALRGNVTSNQSRFK